MYLICSDLDRTLLPNGLQEESPAARPLLHRLAARDDVLLAYVSGRDAGLIRAAIGEYALPLPAYAIGDVGTTLYRIEGDSWEEIEAWAVEIAPDWQGREAAELALLFADLGALTLQEPARQGRFKLSYYADPALGHARLLEAMERRLTDLGLHATLIWSVDETSDTGLLDIIPRGATKLHAVRFLMTLLDIDASRLLYAGDSGNDLPVLTSGLQSVLVANATGEVRRAACAAGSPNLYCADGGYLGMNGNYCAGLLEGVARFLPELSRHLEESSS